MVDNTTLPTADQAFGANLPTADQAFGASQPQEQPSYSGGVADYFFHNTGPGRILTAFGKGQEQEWGGVAKTWQKSTEQELTKMGVFNDYTSGRTSLIKSFNEAFLRPAVAGIAGVQAVVGGLGAATEQIATELQQTGRENAQSPSILNRVEGAVQQAVAEPLGAVPEGFLPEAGVHIPEIQAATSDPVVASNTARAAGVIGEGEEGYFNTKPVTPENLEARQQAAQEAGLPKAPEVPPVQTDPNFIARQIEPGLFKDYDDLITLKQNLRDSLDYTKSQEIGDIERQLTVAQASGDQAKVQNFQNILNDLKISDSSQATEIRNRIIDTDLKIRDMLPDIIQARKNALDYFPTPEEAPKVEGGETSKEEQIVQPKTEVNEEATPVERQVETGLNELRAEPSTGIKQLSPKAGPTKTAGLATKLESSAIEKGLTDSLKDKAEFTSTTRDYQVKGTLKLLNDDYENAKEIAFGNREAPSDLRRNVIYDAVRRKAELEGDLDTIQKLANSPVASEVSAAAQTLGLQGKFDEESPTTLIQLVQRAREAVRSNRTARAFERERVDIVNHLSNSIDTTISNKDSWATFIRSIECDY